MIIPKNLFICWLAACTTLLAGLNPGVAAAADVTAYTENLPPLNYEQDGQLRGFSVELLQKMASEAGLTLDIQVMPWIRAYQTAQGDGDNLLFTLVRTPEREALFQWIGPVAKRQVYLFRLTSRSEILPRNLDEARRWRIGVVRESASTRLLMANGFELGRDLEPGQDDYMNMRKLQHGRIDMMLALDASAYFNLAKLGGAENDIVPALLVDGQSEYYIGASPRFSPAKLQRLQQAFAKLQRNGELAALRRRYFGS
ncbi:substrate-binding periplasmic protein [Chitinilyticum piscinae]|uniref:Transporter substrate-binding domain-containing protein n=1 Tax=Chitinilyticum piscinae TaxID=2866724 RepID=A0A8J7FPS9_9NEIS|nr:transporter substrate-binding domain-containing protein [Chitinilyticum piscinae]MBE9610981.1 transporter substrate-binding domain-containing protein [Chitinilyticum piscinae]